MTREQYVKQLDLLKESVLSFGEMVELIFRDSMASVIDLDVKLAEKKHLPLSQKLINLRKVLRSRFLICLHFSSLWPVISGL